MGGPDRIPSPMCVEAKTWIEYSVYLRSSVNVVVKVALLDTFLYWNDTLTAP